MSNDMKDILSRMMAEMFAMAPPPPLPEHILNVEVFGKEEAEELGFKLSVPGDGKTNVGCDVEGINRFPACDDPFNHPETALAIETEGLSGYEYEGYDFVRTVSGSASRLSSAPELLQLVEDGDSFHIVFPMLAHLEMEGHNDEGCPGDIADPETVECRWVHVCDIKVATVPKPAVKNCMEVPELRAEVEEMISNRLMSEMSELHGVPITFGIGGDC
jgi:hypothetical protein